MSKQTGVVLLLLKHSISVLMWIFSQVFVQFGGAGRRNNKELLKEWSNKNFPKLPSDFTQRSGYKVWWNCPNNKLHIYEETINNRVRGRGCPFCAGKKLHPRESLQALYPEIAKQWHVEKNKGLLPSSVFPHSNKKVWWQCDKFKEHNWFTTPNSRLTFEKG